MHSQGLPDKNCEHHAVVRRTGDVNQNKGTSCSQWSYSLSVLTMSFVLRQIYDMSEQQHRLLASGTHLKMAPSRPFNVSSSMGTTKLPHEAKL